ncbi:VCBS domain-containing protein [Aquamicrobium lusatiense]|uniref:BapA/Bap/LapF family large adhesin n=1 Tax=Aquamicrobium lusatiense TaxID=89772 RepID=UPI002456FAC7|nr:BapA/Bap/LapF family large adhesin [Aquamicrobium lusatiense]MDH4989328.1 VCBS domain-containing protein [Aquamicrobium lusatiense]
MLGISALEFEVDPGHTQDLTFAFNSLVSVELLGGLQLVIQRWDEETGQWTTIDGSQPGATLLAIGLLGGGGTGAVVEGLQAGEYRAFMTNEGGLAVNLTLGSTLAATGIDNDYTQVGGYEAVEATGNVLANDAIPEGTVVQSVNGVLITGDETIVEGDYGTLLISPDGTFIYTPTAEGQAIGQVEQFQYTLVDPASGDTATATLYVQIGSDAVELTWDVGNPSEPAAFEFGATADAADAGVVWENVTDDNYFNETGSALLSGGLGQTTTYTSESFAITDNMEVTGSIELNVLIAALSNGNLFLEREISPGTWQTVASDPFNIILGGLGTVASINLDNIDFEEGTYRVRATLSGTLVNVSANIVTDVNVVHLDQFEVGGLTPATGSVLANDEAGSSFTSLEFFDENTGNYVAVGSGPLSIQGQFGTLTIDAEGNYTYSPSLTADHFSEPQLDSFEYRLVHPTGAIAESSVDITVEPSGAGVSDALLMAGFEDTIGLEGLDDLSHDSDLSDPDPSHDSDFALTLEDGSAQDGDIPLDGLSVDNVPEEGDSDLPDLGSEPAWNDAVDFEAPIDPFGHLAQEDDLNHGSTGTI